MFVETQHSDVVRTGVHVWSESKRRRFMFLPTWSLQRCSIHITWPTCYIEMCMRSSIRTIAVQDHSSLI